MKNFNELQKSDYIYVVSRKFTHINLVTDTNCNYRYKVDNRLIIKVKSVSANLSNEFYLYVYDKYINLPYQPVISTSTLRVDYLMFTSQEAIIRYRHLCIPIEILEL